jgi:hypothetical protein
MKHVSSFEVCIKWGLFLHPPHFGSTDIFHIEKTGPTHENKLEANFH